MATVGAARRLRCVFCGRLMTVSAGTVWELTIDEDRRARRLVDQALAKES
jgi:hypothetical protein